MRERIRRVQHHLNNPTDRPLLEGDLLVIDTGTVFDGYFCDFDRNFAFGHATDRVRRAYAAAFAATETGFQIIRPGIRASNIWAAMWKVLEQAGGRGNGLDEA